MKENYGPNKSEEMVGKAFKKLGVTVYYQYNFGPYTLDIFLPKYNVCVEIYGPHHLESKRQKIDKARQEFIEAKGIQVYIITAQQANTVDGVRNLVNRVLMEHNIPVKRKIEEDIFNKGLHDQLNEWVNNIGFGLKTMDEQAENPKEDLSRENDFGALLDKYYPVKRSGKKPFSK